MNDVVIRNSDSGAYFYAVYFGRSRMAASLHFVSKIEDALFFENEDVAQATIDFISNVIDWETGECLEIVIVT